MTKSKRPMQGRTANAKWRSVLYRARTGVARFWTALASASSQLNTLLMVVLTGLGVYVAVQANGIAMSQYRSMVMQSTISQSQSAPLLSFETSPSLRAQIASAGTSDSMDGTRTIDVINSGSPVANLICDPITILEFEFAKGDDDSESVVIPVEGFYEPFGFTSDISMGTGKLHTILGTPNNLGVLYALLDSIDAAAQADAGPVKATFMTYVRTEYTNILGSQENRLYQVSPFGVFRVDPDYAGDLLLAYQNRVKHDEVLDLETATAEEAIGHAVAAYDRNGADPELPYYEPGSLPPYKDPNFDLTSWAQTFYQEPAWELQ